MIDARISHYRLTRKLGAGTYGEVYEGVHVHDDELRVAVKIVSPALVQDPRFLDALKRECRQLDRMNHANIVRFRELVVNEGGVAMVLELLRGQDLHDRLADGPLPVDTAVSVVEAILEGLGHAHAAGVLHRDIKPGNVYWCDDGRIVILDFGIARAADGTQATKTGQMVGTFDYMAPERMSGSGGTASSDVYAVGLIAWELLAGRPASPEGEVARKLMWHMMEGVGDAAKVAATLGCPGWFAEVIATMAAKDLTARPADGAAALALLREKRAGAGAPSAAPAGRRPPPSTVMGPAPVGSVPPVQASVPSPGRSVTPATVLAPTPARATSVPPSTTRSGLSVSAYPRSATPVVDSLTARVDQTPESTSSSPSVHTINLAAGTTAGCAMLTLMVAGAVLSAGAWLVARETNRPASISFDNAVVTLNDIQPVDAPNAAVKNLRGAIIGNANVSCEVDGEAVRFTSSKLVAMHSGTATVRCAVAGTDAIGSYSVTVELPQKVVLGEHAPCAVAQGGSAAERRHYFH